MKVLMLWFFKKLYAMNGIDFLLDTNVLIHIREGNKQVEPFIHYQVAVSFITEIELLGRKDISKQQKLSISEMLNSCTIINLNEDIKAMCIKLKQQYTIKTPDAIIAATAIINQLPLVSNDADFEKIKQLDFIKV
jgi:predicted nucleic acid-binding protein